jgi:uncharacterized membrane protein
MKTEDNTTKQYCSDEEADAFIAAWEAEDLADELEFEEMFAKIEQDYIESSLQNDTEQRKYTLTGKPIPTRIEKEVYAVVEKERQSRHNIQKGIVTSTKKEVTYKDLNKTEKIIANIIGFSIISFVMVVAIAMIIGILRSIIPIAPNTVADTKPNETVINDVNSPVDTINTSSNTAPRQESSSAPDVIEEDAKFLCRTATILNDDHSASRADFRVIAQANVKCFEAVQRLETYKKTK